MLVLATTAALVGCSHGDADERTAQPPVASSADPGRAAAALQRLEDAVRQGRTADPQLTAESLPASARYVRGVLGNADRLEIRGFQARFIAADQGASRGLPPGQWVGSVEVTWRVSETAERRARSEVRMVFAGVDNRAVPVGLVNGEQPAPLWLTSPVTVKRSGPVVVLVATSAEDADARVSGAGGSGAGGSGAGHSGSRWNASDYLRFGRVASTQVKDTIPDWDGRLVLEVPADGAGMDTALGTRPGAFDAIAAVTASVDRGTDQQASLRVVVNGRVMNGLTEPGAQVVISHESVHVARRDPLDTVTPKWLVEGYADYVALRAVDLPRSRTAARIVAQVRQEGLPSALPGDAEFAGDSADLEATYQSAWLVCEVLDESGGPTQLASLRDLVAQGDEVDDALREVYGFGTGELIRRWRNLLREEAQ